MNKAPYPDFNHDSVSANNTPTAPAISPEMPEAVVMPQLGNNKFKHIAIKHKLSEKYNLSDLVDFDPEGLGYDCLPPKLGLVGNRPIKPHPIKSRSFKPVENIRSKIKIVPPPSPEQE